MDGTNEGFCNHEATNRIVKLAPEFKIMPKRKENSKIFLLNREKQPLVQNKSATSTSQITQISSQKISKNSSYNTITKQNSNRIGERFGKVTTIKNPEKIPIKQKPTDGLIQKKM